MTDELPDPLIPPEVNLEGMDAFLMDAKTLLSSSFMARATPQEFRAGVRLWLHSWLESVPGSLPNDDRTLCRFSGCGDDLRKWRHVRAMAMHKFVLCSDNRWYHPVLAKDVLRAWAARQKNIERTAKATATAARLRKPSVTDAPPAPSRTPLRHPSISNSKKERITPSTESPTGPGEGGAQEGSFALIEVLIAQWPKPSNAAYARNHWTKLIGEGASPAHIHRAGLAYIDSLKGEPVQFVPMLHRWLEGRTWERPIVAKGATVGASEPEDRRRVLVSQCVRFGTAWHPTYGPDPDAVERDAVRLELEQHLRDFGAHRVRWDEARWGRRPTLAEVEAAAPVAHA